jgi:hypothetical protein
MLLATGQNDVWSTQARTRMHPCMHDQRVRKATLVAAEIDIAWALCLNSNSTTKLEHIHIVSVSLILTCVHTRTRECLHEKAHSCTGKHSLLGTTHARFIYHKRTQETNRAKRMHAAGKHSLLGSCQRSALRFSDYSCQRKRTQSDIFLSLHSLACRWPRTPQRVFPGVAEPQDPPFCDAERMYIMRMSECDPSECRGKRCICIVCMCVRLCVCVTPQNHVIKVFISPGNVSPPLPHHRICCVSSVRVRVCVCVCVCMCVCVRAFSHMKRDRIGAAVCPVCFTRWDEQHSLSLHAIVCVCTHAIVCVYTWCAT